MALPIWSTKSLVAVDVNDAERTLSSARHDAGLRARKARRKRRARTASRAATPNITGTCSSGRKPNGKPGRPAEWLDDYGRRIDNLRAALDWAFSPGGDASIGVALTAAAVPLWMHLSLLDECRSRVEQALAALDAGKGGDPRREMKLYAALASSSYWALPTCILTSLRRSGRALDEGTRNRGEP